MEKRVFGRDHKYLLDILSKRESASIQVYGLLESLKELLEGLDLDILSIADGANLKVAEFKELLERSNKTSGKKKVLVIDRAHLLKPECYNMALKTIEDPSSFFIFVSQAELPATIRSRSLFINLAESSQNSEVFDRNVLEEKMGVFLDSFLEYVLKNRVDMVERVLKLRVLHRDGVNLSNMISDILVNEVGDKLPFFDL